MSVEFHEEDPVFTPRQQKPPHRVSPLTRLVYALKLAEDEAGAQRVMLIASLSFLAAAVLLFLNLAGII